MNNALTYHLTAELLASLEAEGHPIGTGKHLQVQELLRLLPKDTDAETLRLALCPLLARNPQEQARVYEMFDECQKRVEAMMPTDMEGEPSETVSASKAAEKELKKWRWRIIIPAAILVLVAAVGLYFYFQETPVLPIEQQTDETDEIATWEDSTLFQPKPYPYDHDLAKYYALTPPPVWKEWLFTHWWWLRLALLIPFTLLLTAIWRYLEQKRRKLIAEREPKDQPPYFWNICIESGDEILTGESFAYTLQVMRRRMGADTFALDLPRTIHATAERGGLPEFRFREQTQPVDYLLLIDRQSIQNHRARLFDTLYQAFREQEIEMARFFYDSDMRVCFNEEHPHGVGLQEIQQRYGSARLLLVGTGAQLISPLSGKLAPWTSLFAAWKQRALFTPKPLADWGRLERRLPEIFTVLPATLQSLSFWVEELEDGQDARFEEWRTRVKDAPQLPIQPNEHDPLPLLRLHYDTPTLQWIAACAIYPSLHWDLTLWLGRQIAVGSLQSAVAVGSLPSAIPNPQSPELVSVEGLLHLFRLPWFVEGEIPVSARAALLDWLEHEHPSLLLQLRAELALLLQHSPPPQASVASDDYQMNIALNEWLTTPDERRKKELEQKIAQLMESGAEADFTVLKYLERPRTPLDFVVPDAWKKYVYPSGYRGLGWQGKWKDLLWVLPIWVLGMAGLLWPWEMNLYECQGEKVEYVLGNETISICLDSPEKKVVYLEWLVRDAIQAGNIKMADSLLTERSTPIVKQQTQNSQQGTDGVSESGPPPDIDPNNPPPPSPYLSPVPLSAETDASVRKIYEEGDRNIAVVLFNQGIQFSKADSICYYFRSALNFDSNAVDVLFASNAICKKSIPEKKLYEIYPTIAGKVISFENQIPIPEVNIIGSGLRTMTNRNGYYTIQLPSNYPRPYIVLRFEKEGCTSVEVNLSINKIKRFSDIIMECKPDAPIPVDTPSNQKPKPIDKLDKKIVILPQTISKEKIVTPPPVGQNKKTNQNYPYEIGDEVEDFRLKDVDGKMVSLIDYKDVKGYIVIFTCNHDPYSQLYEQRIIDLHRKYNPKGYPVIAINPNSSEFVPEDSYEEMQKRAREMKYPFAYLHDEDQIVYPKFGVRRTPSVFLLDGNKILRYFGAIDDNPELPSYAKNRWVENAINALIRGEKPNPERTLAIGSTVKKKPKK